MTAATRTGTGKVSPAAADGHAAGAGAVAAADDGTHSSTAAILLLPILVAHFNVCQLQSAKRSDIT